MDHGVFYSSKFECDFCGKSHKDNCLLNVGDRMTMRSVLKKLKHDRDFEIVVQWNTNPQANLKQLEFI